MKVEIPPFLLGETEWPDASDLLMHLPIQLAYEGVPATNIATNTAYGDFNGTDNYIDCGFKPADITAGKPFEVVFKHQATPAQYIQYAFSNDVANTWKIQEQITSGDLRVYYKNGYIETFTVAQMGVYAGTWLKAKIEVSGANNLISLWSVDGTQISTTRTVTSGSLPNSNIFLGCSTILGSPNTFYSTQIRELTGNGQTWYFNPASSNTIKATDGTSLTVQGDTTDFFRGTPTIDPSGWSTEIATGNRRFKVLYNPDLDAINLELNELFWDDATKTPKIIDHTTIGSNYLGKNLLFQCTKGEPYSDLILFATPRTSSTTPSIEQVAAYLQLTLGDIVTFNGVEFTFGGRPVRF